MTPADLAPFRALFVRALGACDPKPTLCKFDPGHGLTIVLRDAARTEVPVRVVPEGGVIADDVPETHAAWVAAIRGVVAEPPANPASSAAWSAALRR